jgi:predicted MPP superfamily phosphohydrolase
LTAILWTLLALALALGLFMILVAPARLRILEIDAAIPGLPSEFEGYSIGVLSDLHQSVLPGARHTRRAVRSVMRFRPDLITLLGDYGVSFKRLPALSLWLYRRDLEVLGRELAPLHAPDGVVALIGNHDYYASGELTDRWLRQLGARVLVNERMELTRGQARLAIAGVDDTHEGHVDPSAACADLPPDLPRIILSHNPDGLLELDMERARPALVLAGHTHGGQICFPIFGAPLRLARICTRATASGWVPNDRAPLFISAGVGSQIPLRFGTIPDVVIVTLRRA